MEAQLNKNSNQQRIDKLTEMLVKSPNDCFLLHALGLEYTKIGEKDEAILQFEKVIAIDENYVGTYYHLAKLYEKNNKDQAFAIYHKGIEIAQKNKAQHLLNELRNALEDFEDE
jgi:tetratricopeptide (TPR) repeat protein